MWCNSLLSGGFVCGAPGRTRTGDLRFRKPLLYPLSYRGASGLVRLKDSEKLVEIAGLEPATSALRTPRSPN